MLKKSFGFTLIELLAVIIILAVIALIATPIVLNVVDSAKESARKSSVAGYADATKLAVYNYKMANGGTLPDDINNLDIQTNNEVNCGCKYYDQKIGVILSNCTLDKRNYYSVFGKVFNEITEFNQELKKANILFDSTLCKITSPVTIFSSNEVVESFMDKFSYNEEEKTIEIYSVAHVTNKSSDELDYTIRTDYLPLSLEEYDMKISNIEVINTMDDFDNFNQLKQLADISEYSNSRYWAYATSQELLEHSITESQIDKKEIFSYCYDNVCDLKVHMQFNNLSSLSYHNTTNYNGTDIQVIYASLKINVQLVPKDTSAKIVMLGVPNASFDIQNYKSTIVNPNYSKEEVELLLTRFATAVSDNSANIYTVENGKIFVYDNYVEADVPADSYVLVEFICNNHEQTPNATFPLTGCLNYEYVPLVSGYKSNNIVDIDYPGYGSNSGDYETFIQYTGRGGTLKVNHHPTKFPQWGAGNIEQIMHYRMVVIKN